MRRLLIIAGLLAIFAPLGAATASAQAAPTSVAGPACLAADLSAVTQVELTDVVRTVGPALAGDIRFTNRSEHPCTLAGTPSVRVVDAHGAVLPVTEVNASSAAGDHISVQLPPNGRALVGVSWRNFCIQPLPPTPYLLRITLADGGVVSAPFATTPPFSSGNVAPPCAFPTSSSAVLVGAFQTVPPSVPHDGRYFPQTGFRIDNATIWDYFQHRGGVPTFGYPTSRTFLFQGFTDQFFQRKVVQLDHSGKARLLNLLDSGLMPYTSFNGSSFPGSDSGLVSAAPSPTDQLATLAWVRQHAPDSVNGAPTHFYATFQNTVTAAVAFPDGGDASLLPGFDLELWGVPTSNATADPTNHHFIYLRWQRGIMHFDAACACTQDVLLADYFKAILTGQNLPADLAQESASSPFRDQYDPSVPNWVHNPSLLPNTDLTDAFTQE